ncbi:MAG TPA: lysine-sensitive aspartokinase 3 [Pyrinomonadaceae bacterium]|nr:lysine-sensitive aspartokinase 3 [Pyrinomonadaceae bacterium]
MTTIMKFGGTSVADVAALRNVATIVRSFLNSRPVVVVSAMAGVTDSLVTSTIIASQGQVSEAIKSLETTFARHKSTAQEGLSAALAEAFAKEVDRAANSINGLLKLSAEYPSLRPELHDSIVSCGEILSSTLLAAVLNEVGVTSQQIDARECIITSDDYTCALPLMPETFARARANILPVLDHGAVPVLGGFIGATSDGRTTTLGRGGSDYAAAIIGAALRVDEIQIWTDVSGVLTADPRVVPEAHTVERLSYAEAAELAYFGAKVLHPKTIQPAIEDSIPVRICNSRAPGESDTLVCAQTITSPRTIKAIAHKSGVTTVQVTSARMLGAYGFLRALFEVFDRHRTVVDVVTTSEVSVSLSLDDASSLPSIIAELETLGTVRVDERQAIICVVGEGLKETSGIAAKLFNAISDIPVSLISQGASSINFTFAVAEERVHEAVGRLHQEFFKEKAVSAV